MVITGMEYSGGSDERRLWPAAGARWFIVFVCGWIVDPFFGIGGVCHHVSIENDPSGMPVLHIVTRHSGHRIVKGGMAGEVYRQRLARSGASLLLLGSERLRGSRSALRFVRRSGCLRLAGWRARMLPGLQAAVRGRYSGVLRAAAPGFQPASGRRRG